MGRADYPRTLDIDTLRDYEQRGLITSRKHPLEDLWVWNYTAETQYGQQWDEVTRLTRGVVTNSEGIVVAPCIPKFFNLSQTNYRLSDFNVAYEKLDGSLIHVFRLGYRNWIASSRGSFESDQAKWAQELIDSIDTDKLNHRAVYVCELIHPSNRIVLDYGDEYSLRLISVFQNSPEFGWEETRPHEWLWPWDKAQVIEDVPAYLQQPGIEGVVLVNDYDRVKVKTDEYVELHRVVTNLTTKNVLRAHIDGELDDVLDVVPDEYFDRIERLVEQFESVVEYVYKGVYYEFHIAKQQTDSRKEFALKVKGMEHAGFLFAMLDDKPVEQMIREDVYRNYERWRLEL